MAGEYHASLTKDTRLAEISVLLSHAHLHSYSTASVDRGSAEPEPGSRMALDCEEMGFGYEKVSPVQRVPAAWLTGAAEMLTGIGACHEYRAVLFAPGPLIRACMELSARADWVLAGATAEDRCARAWLSRLVGNGDDAKTSRIGNGSVLYDAQSRVDALVTQIQTFFGADALDMTKKQPRDWKLHGQPWGETTKNIADFVNRRFPGADGHVFYRIATLLTHPTGSGAFIFMRPEQESETEFVFEWDIGHVTRICKSVMASWALANRALLDYQGWPTSDLEAWLAQVLEMPG